jgi:hypothetical protein
VQAQAGLQGKGLGGLERVKVATLFVVLSMSALLGGCGGGAAGGSEPTPTPPVTPAPTSPASQCSISGVSPGAGPLTGGTTITIHGADFAGSAAVRVGGHAAVDVAVLDGGRITCRTPAGAQADAADVVVSCSLSGTATAARAFTYRAAPTIAGATPVSGPLAGGIPITLTGTGFTGTVTVTIGGAPAGDVRVTDGTRIQCVAPASPVAGPMAVVVTSSETGSVTLAGAFTYNALPTFAAPPSPARGPLGGGTLITVDGTNFLGSVELTIGGVAATEVTVTGGTRITARTPPADAAGGAPLVVTCSGSGSATLANAFTYNGAPQVTAALSPNNGPLAGGIPLRISGASFLGTVAVTVGGRSATNVVVAGGTIVDCTLPPGVGTGPAPVVVTCSESGTVTLPGGFTYNVAPAITGPIVPASGPRTGGTPLVITGTNFLGEVSVTVGGAPTANVSVTGGTRIECITPALAVSGPVDVIVNCSASGTVTARGGFSYNSLPAITAIGPGSGPEAGGTPITIDGTSFVGAVTLTVGGAPAGNVVVTGGTRITCVTPPGSGTAAVVVTCTQSGAVMQAAAFQYNAPPVVTAIPAPASGPRSGGTAIAIDGSGFWGTVSVLIAGVAASNVVVTDGRRITCVTPATGASGPVDVVVNCSASGSATLRSGYVYNALPAIEKITPPAGPRAGGTRIAITGGSFLGTVNVTVGNAAATNVHVTAGVQISFDTPPGVAGAADVIVTCSESGTVTLPWGFRYNALPTSAAPTPATGPQDGGTPITLLGSNFLGVVGVTVGGAPATNVVITGGTQIDCRTPAGTRAGAVDVVVTCTESGSVTVTGAFTYRPRPAVTAPLSPASGLQSGGTLLTILGTNFLGAVSVTVNGLPATSVSVSGGTQITCVTPAGEVAGPVPITITSSTHGSLTLPDAFEYVPVVTLQPPVAPSNGSVQGGTFVTLSGQNFVGALTVRFGSNNATNVTVTGSTTITCRTPAGTAGATSVSVITPGNGAISLPNAFTYNPAPTILPPISPSSGPQSGTPITINGTGFSGTVSVTVGALPATNVVVRGTTQITCDAPAVESPAEVGITVVSSSNGSVTLAGAFTYTPSVTLNVSSSSAAGAGPAAIAVGDLNRDGRADVAVPCSAGASVTILLGNAGGNFTAGPALSVAGVPSGVAIADLDRDGTPDLLVPDRAGNGLALLRGTGAANFTSFAGSPVAVGVGPRQVTVGDFDGDGMTDVAVANETSGTVSLLRGNGAGGVSAFAGSPVTVGAGPTALITADLDRDGLLDLAVGNTGHGTVSILRGNGAGGFTAGAPIPIAAGLSELVVADVDLDGRLDLVVAGASALSVLRGDGALGFSAAPGSPVTLPGAVRGIGVADMDGNGQPDVVASTATQILVYGGIGTGALFAPTPFAGGAALGLLALPDLNRDGRPDVAITDGAPAQVTSFRNTTSWMGTGRFSTPAANGFSLSYGFNATGDLNRDGLLDVVGTTSNSSGGGFNRVLALTPGTLGTNAVFTTGGYPINVVVADLNRDGVLDGVTGAGAAFVVFLGNGAGGFGAGSQFSTAGGIRAVTVGDLNRDGRPDVVAALNSSFQLFSGDGAGGFTLTRTVHTGGSSTADIEVGDFNRDGRLDVVATDRSAHRIFVFLGDGAGNFATAPGYPIALTDAASTALLDANRDGILDLGVGQTYGSTIAVFLGTGTGAFTWRGTFPAGSVPMSVVAADLDRDGDCDLACANGFSGITTLLNNGSGDYPVNRGIFTDDDTGSIAIADMDRDGFNDLITGARQFGPIEIYFGL